MTLAAWQSPFAQAVWTFDAPSFFVGVVVTLLIVGLIYLFRRPLQDGIGRLRERARDLRSRLTAGAESRYRESLRDWLDELHVGEWAAPFEAVYRPPRFSPPAPRPSLSPDTTSPSPITLRQALSATQRLAALGEPGLGRTALLVYLARVFAEDKSRGELHLDENRLPVLAHFAEMDWGSSADTQGDDPAKLLIDAAIGHAPRLIAANLASLLRAKIAAKGLIVLLDGWDEVAQADRDAARAWLNTIVQRYPGHRYVMTASAADADALRGAGFACLSIAPLQPRGVRSLAERWVTAAEGSASDVTLLTESMQQPPGTPPRPLDMALAASVWRQRGVLPLSAPAAYDRWIDLALADNGVADTATARSMLGRLAWTLLNESRAIATREEIGALASASLPVAGAEPDSPAKTTAERAATLAEDSALFIPLGGGVAFAHPRVVAYLAAAHAHNVDQAMTLAARLSDPAWTDATFFFAALGDATPLVNAALAAPDDLFQTTLTRLGEWASIAPADAGWRGRVLSDLVKVMMASDTPDPLRERVMRVLVSIRDKGLAYLFKQALSRPEPHFKRLAARAFGLMRREADAPAVAAALGDADAGVRLEALRALGEIGGQAAVDALAQALLELDDDGRRAAAEGLANCGPAGWELLVEGASLSDDPGADIVRVRRAAAYGLARVGEEWARDRLAKLEREDKQWLVRSAATDALQAMRADSGEGEEPIDLTPLDMDNLGWLVQWAASKGQPVGVGKAAAQALQRALEDPDPTVRLAAAHTYAYLGDAESIPALRARLKDDNALVRDAAYHALEDIARRKGEVVPQ